MARASRLSALPKRMADFISPMDCAPVPNLPDGSQWVYEITRRLPCRIREI